MTRTLTEEEQETMEKADNPEKEFFRYWTMKESFLKLTGDGITKDMKNLEKPAWYDCFEIKEDISCCVSAEESCQLFCREISAEEFFSMFGMQ